MILAEYRRFISYIYAYEGDMKTKNVGFAKIEARNGQCRMSVSIKGAYECSGQALVLYGYGLQGDSFLLVPIGKIPVKNGVGEAVFGKKEDDLGGSGFSLDFVRGLFLRSGKTARKSYLTAWDDMELTISSLQRAPIVGETWMPGQNTMLRAAELAEGQNGSLTAETEQPEGGPGGEQDQMEETGESCSAEQGRQDEILTAEAEETDESPAGEQERDDTDGLNGQAEESPAEQEAAALLGTAAADFDQKVHSTTEIDRESLRRENGTEITEFAGRETVTAGLFGNEAAVTAGPSEDEAAVSSEGTVLCEEAAPGEAERNAEAGAMPDQFFYREGFMELPLWDNLKRILPRKRAFVEEGWDILQIHLQDIGRLPRENWPYGNNSFVLHGYYQYRYLILARRPRAEREKYQNQYQYILGVPGIFKPQEKFMASMFGLPEFKRAAGKRDEEFGFWCGSIHM